MATVQQAAASVRRDSTLEKSAAAAFLSFSSAAVVSISFIFSLLSVSTLSLIILSFSVLSDFSVHFAAFSLDVFCRFSSFFDQETDDSDTFPVVFGTVFRTESSGFPVLSATVSSRF